MLELLDASRRESSGWEAELEVLGELLAAARNGRSGVLVVRGEAGIGKSVLLDSVAARAEGFHVARVAGVESEMELPYAGLQQLCRPFVDCVPFLPEPQRAALDTAFGLAYGSPPDRFLVGLAVLQLLARLAEDQPVLWVVDDAQWLDRVSVQTIEFVARRLLAEPIALLIAARDTPDRGDFAGLPELRLHGLGDADAAVLLGSVVAGPTDPGWSSASSPRVTGTRWPCWSCRTRGRPRSSPKGWRIRASRVVGTLEDGFAAAAVAAGGFPTFVDPGRSRTARRSHAAVACGRATRAGWDAATPAEAAGLIEFGVKVRFRHPLVRAAAYRKASTCERLDVHTRSPRPPTRCRSGPTRVAPRETRR